MNTQPAVQPVRRPHDRTEQLKLLERRIRESGLSATQFSLRVLTREPAQVYKWLKGERSIPNVVVDFLADPWVVPWPEPATEAEVQVGA